MKVKNSFRIEKTSDDALEKIRIKEKITKTDAINNIIQLGLEAYLNKKETSESAEIEKSLSPRFDVIQEQFDSLSDQIKDFDLKSYRLNIFLIELAKKYFDDPEKYISFDSLITKKVEGYKKQIKYVPELGIVVLKYLKSILGKNIPDQFFSEIETIYSSMKNQK